MPTASCGVAAAEENGMTIDDLFDSSEFMGLDIDDNEISVSNQQVFEGMDEMGCRGLVDTGSNTINAGGSSPPVILTYNIPWILMANCLAASGISLGVPSMAGNRSTRLIITCSSSSTLGVTWSCLSWRMARLNSF